MNEDELNEANQIEVGKVFVHISIKIKRDDKGDNERSMARQLFDFRIQQSQMKTALPQPTNDAQIRCFI